MNIFYNNLEPLVITTSDVSINVSLIDDVNVTLNITVSIVYCIPASPKYGMLSANHYTLALPQLTQFPDPCPSYPVTNLTINITQNTDMWIESIDYDGVDMTMSYLTVTLDSGVGLAHNQVYTIVIEAENIVGSTVSEDITLCELWTSIFAN